MQTELNRDQIKNMFMSELHGILENDQKTRRLILEMTRDRYAKKERTEDRIDRILAELKRDRERSDKKWEAQERKWEAQERKWEENQETIREMLASVKSLDKKYDSTIGALGARWGIRSEEAFRDGLKAILEDSFDVKVERYEDFDHDGEVFGHPDQVEMDVIVYNGALLLCEIKSSMSKSEMYVFWRKKQFYEEKHQRKADRILVISPMVDSYAVKVAKNLGIEIFGYADDVKLQRNQTE